MKRKLIAAMLALTLTAAGLTGCGGKNSSGGKGSDDTYTVTMAYMGDKKEDTERIENKINEIMKKDLRVKSST